MKELFGTVLRTVLKVGGGALVAKGVIAEGALEEIIGAVLTLFGIGWGIWEAKKAAINRIDANAAKE